MHWYQPRKNGWPKVVVDKPYTSDFGRLQFMPRHKTPQKAFELLMRRETRVTNAH